MVGIEVVEYFSNMAEDISSVLAPVVAGISENVKLHIEQFLELESIACVACIVSRFGTMYIPQCLVAAYQ